jgi:DNA-binding response OmpR family regulator
MRILLVEDDTRVASTVATALEAAGFVVEQSSDGEDAWFRGDTETWSAVILDLGLPGMDGLAVLRRWREAGQRFPVLILTARGDWHERVEGIDAGADDYLPKPFRMEELLARLRALARRAAGQASPVLRAGALTLDTRRMQVSRDGVPVHLSPTEYRLVAYLMQHAGRVVPQLELTEQLYAQDFERESNAVEVLVGRVRRKLGAELIQTRRGFGYVIEPDAAPPNEPRRQS